jgi:glycosyltransferase involved in cell wall biosynthesis
MELSVCLIVKDEEKVIERCLNCVKKFANEIIIVDTGSTDKTKLICQSFTKNIYDLKWEYDFSKARNFAFSKATKDYIMWIDADDIIKQSEIDKINSLKNDKVLCDVYMLKYAVSFNSYNQPTFVFYRERIFKRSDNFLFSGFIHEAVSVSGIVKYLDITIEHRKIKNGDIKRNLKIYRRNLGQKFSARDQYYYSKELFYNGYYKKCIKQIKKFLKMSNKYLPNINDAYLTMAKCYYFINNLLESKKIIFEFLNNYFPNSEVICLLADIFSKENNFNNAIFYYECALNLKCDIQSGNFYDLNYYYYIPYINLVCLYYKIGDIDNAKKYQKIMFSKYPKDEKVIFNQNFFNSLFNKK